MKVVLDTNVVVSALLSPGGPCRRITDLVFEGSLEASVDARILAEYEAVARRPHLPIEPAEADELLTLVSAVARPVPATPLNVNLPHQDDLPFLEVAHAAGAILVTGNLRHFPKSQRAGVTVLSPRQFLDHLAASR
ncbi:MAG: putative toxin-antitoxin system toxin component, PIN family [Planctomycetota bacterium]